MEYEVIYSQRRTLSLTVRAGKVIVRSPFSVGDSVIFDFVQKHQGWIENKLNLLRSVEDRFEKITPEQIKSMRLRAKDVLTEKTKHYSERMGLKYGRITITSAKTRFGSCSSKGNISYSYRLMTYPEEAIDYVVVHELAHLIEMNHSKQFYAIIEKILPDYKERIKLLKS